MSEINQGKVVQVMGAVVDVKFDDHLLLFWMHYR